MFSKINFIVPTYKRSKTKLPTFLTSCLNMAAEPSRVFFTYIVNEDDEETLEYLQKQDHPGIYTVVLPPSEKPHLAQLMNAGFEKTTFRGEEYVYGYAGDDFVARTQYWDSLVLDAANRSHGMKLIWGWDGYLNDLPTWYFMPSRLWRAMGAGPWVYPNAGMELTDLIVRDTLAPFGLMLRLPDLTFEHMHASREGVGADDTFNRLQGADNSKATAQDVAVYIKKCQENLRAYAKEHKK